VSRSAIVSVALLCTPAFSAPAFGQRVIIIPRHGSGDELVTLSDLPPEVRAALRQELHCEPAAGFIFWRCYVFANGFDLWTWNGRFVLYEGSRYWELPREEIEQLLGPERSSRLRVPWRYRLPPGLTTIVGVVGVLWFYVHWQGRAGKRFNRLMKDDRYVDALQVYAGQCVQIENLGMNERQACLAAATDHLVVAGVSLRRAEADVRLLVSTVERQQANQLRDEGYELAMAGDWEDAASHYQHAAEIMQIWDVKVARFLRGRVEWCRRELLRASEASSSELPPGETG
jgi:hypothetical protein